MRLSPLMLAFSRVFLLAICTIGRVSVIWKYPRDWRALLLPSMVIPWLFAGRALAEHNPPVHPLVPGGNHSHENHNGDDHAGEYLAAINLSYAGLFGTNLESAGLASAALSFANLNEAVLNSSDLRNPNVAEAITDAQLQSAADVRGVNLSGNDMSGFDLTAIDLSFADLSNANLSNAIIATHKLLFTNLIGANLSEALLGDPGRFDGFVYAGELNLINATTTFQSLGFANLGVLTTMDIATLVANNGVALGTGETVTGNGQVQGQITAGTGSIISADGSLALGDASSLAGFFSDGQLSVGANTVTLQDANQAVLGSLTTLGAGGSSGTLSATNGVIVDFGRNIAGFGTVDTPNEPFRPTIVNGAVVGDSMSSPINMAGWIEGVGTYDNVVFTGTFDPGSSPSTVTMGSGAFAGNLIIELGGTTPGSGYDQLNHILGAGIADLDGTLDTLNLPLLPGDLLWFINYGATSVELVSTYGADFDEDGDVDGNDLAAWEGGFGNAPATHMTGDADALATGFDFLTWQRQLGYGGGAPLAATTTIPEPTSLLLAALGLLTLAALRKRA